MVTTKTSRKPAVKISSKKVAVNKKVTKPTSFTLSLFDLLGKEKSQVVLPKEIFGLQENTTLLTQYVRVYLANQRQSNASTKTRAEVQGSTRKIYKQKGTGRARHGSRRAPLFVGGGTIGGPQNHNFSLKMNKKQKQKALFTALSLKYKEQNTMGLVKETTVLKTKVVMQFLKKTNLNNKKILLVLPELKKNNLVLASRNIPNITLIDSKSINPYILLQNDKVIFADNSIEVLKSHFLKQHEN